MRRKTHHTPPGCVFYTGWLSRTVQLFGRSTRASSGLGAAFLLAVLAVSTPAAAGCLEDGGFLRQSLNCLGMPTIPKFFDPVTFAWKGKQILVVNDGNELLYYNITTPSRPVAIGHSNFNIDNMGDSDYDLLNYSICDDCRYAVGVWKLGTVIWDQGTGALPVFGARRFYPTSSDPRGAYVYADGASQYLVAKYLPDDAGGEGTLYCVNGVADLTALGAVDVPGTLKIANGFKCGAHVYLGMTDNWVYLFRVQGAALTYVCKSPMRAFLLRGKSMSISGNLAVSAFLDGAKLWDVTDWAAPVQLASLPGAYKLAAISGQFMWLSTNGDRISTYDIRNPARPVLMDQAYWDVEAPLAACDMETGGVFSSDGSVLYRTRYVAVQAIGLGRCPPVDVIFSDGFESGTTGGWQ